MPAAQMSIGTKTATKTAAAISNLRRRLGRPPGPIRLRARPAVRVPHPPRLPPPAGATAGVWPHGLTNGAADHGRRHAGHLAQMERNCIVLR